MKIFTYGSSAFLTLVLSTCLVNCSSSTSTATAISTASAYPKTIERAQKQKRYLIMYSGVDTYRITSVEVEKTKQQFTVRLAKLDSLHANNLRKPVIVTEKLLQLYMRDSASYTLDEPHTIPMAKVARIELVP